jgi:hypothetical protein
VGLLSSHAASYAVLNRYLQEFRTAAPQIRPGATLFAVHWQDDTALGADGRNMAAGGVDPFRHAAASILAPLAVLDLTNDWAVTDYHPLKWRPGLDPFDRTTLEVIDFTGYARRTGKTIDYVMAWTGGHAHDGPRDRELLRQLRDQYELVFTSPGTGYVQLYRRRGSDPQGSSHEPA